MICIICDSQIEISKIIAMCDLFLVSNLHLLLFLKRQLDHLTPLFFYFVPSLIKNIFIDLARPKSRSWRDRNKRVPALTELLSNRRDRSTDDYNKIICDRKINPEYYGNIQAVSFKLSLRKWEKASRWRRRLEFVRLLHECRKIEAVTPSVSPLPIIMPE